MFIKLRLGHGKIILALLPIYPSADAQPEIEKNLHSQIRPQSINLSSHHDIRLVISLRMSVPLDIPQPRERIVLLRNDIVEIGLKRPVFLEESLVDLIQGIFLR